MAKTALKLLLVFVEYTETNAKLICDAVEVVDGAQGTDSLLCIERDVGLLA